MNENYPLGSSLTFVADEGIDVGFTASGISKTDARRIGLKFCEASDDEKQAMLDALGPIMIRRSLLVIGNVAARLGDRESAEFAKDLRSRITTGRKTKAAS